MGIQGCADVSNNRQTIEMGKGLMRCQCLLLAIGVLLAVGACSQRTTSLLPVPSSSHATSNDYNYFFLEAVRLQNKGDYAGAFDLLRHCVALDSLAPEAYYLLGVYYADLSLDSLADSSLKRAIALNPKNDDYHERLAQWYLQTEEYSRAIAAYEHLYDNNKSRSDALEILLKLYQQQRNYPMALATIERYEQAEGISEETTLTKMQLYQQSGKREQGYLALQDLCREHPNDVNVKLMMGNWLQQNGRPDEARSLFLAAEQTDPTNENVATSLYDFYRQNGEDSLATIYRDRILLNKHTATSTKMTMLQTIIRSAEQQGVDSTLVLALFDDILRADSTNADIAELKAIYMSMKGMPQEEVDQALIDVLAIAPERTSSRLMLLQNIWSEVNTDAIIALCQPALIYSPQEVAFCYYLGMAYFQRGDTIEALAAFRKGVSAGDHQSDKEMMSSFYNLIGDIEHERGNKEVAYAAYDSCLTCMPTNASCLNNYAYFLALDNKELKRAESMSVKAVNLEPNNATYLDTYAWVLYVQERYSEAQIIIDRTIANTDTTDNNSVLYDHAGDIYVACGDPEQAVAYWREALLTTPDDAAAIRRKIEQYEK